MLESIKTCKKLGTICSVSIFLIFMMAGSSGAVTNISECGTISSEGEYVLNQSFGASPGVNCITMNVNNVIIDGAGYTITGVSNIGLSNFGVRVVSKTNVTLKNLTVSGFPIGIYYRNSPRGNITNINATNNSYGIILDLNSNYHNLTNNNISSNIVYGIYVQNSSYNIIYNNIFNNTNNVFYSGSTNNSWNFTTKQPSTNIVGGPYLGGNFWSDYSVVDGDGDGLGDTPYTVNITDYLPLLIPTYLHTTYSPPTPSGLAATQNNFWVNYTWTAGAGNITDIYNVSGNSGWSNNTITFRNNTVGPHGWSNITVYAYNNSGAGQLSQTPATMNTQVANNVPVLSTIGPKTVTAGDLLTFTISATDADSDLLTNATNASKGSFTSSTGVYTWTPTGSDVGTYLWTFNSSDGYGVVASETITVTVNAAPALPYLPPSPVSIASSQGNFWINYTWSSGLGNVTDSYNVSVNGLWNNGSAATYTNSTLGAHGWSNISVYAFNSSDTGTLNPIPLTGETKINNNAPVQTGISDKTVTAGNWLKFTVTATDADGDSPTYGRDATKGSLDPLTGEFTWLTTDGDIGTYIWEFNSSDIFGGIDTETITITVNPVPSTGEPQINNHAPVQAGILDKTITTGNWLNFTVSATDADGDIPIYGTDATKGSLDPITGKFTWLTTGNDVGTYIWEFSSSDIYGGIDTETITVTVDAAACIAYLPPSPVSIASSQGNFWINYTWSSGLGNVTDSYNVSVNDVWNNVSAATYTNSTLGVHGWSNISVYAFNSSGTGTLNPIPLTSETQINNRAPVQAGIFDKTVTAGNWVNFTVSATDADGDIPIYGTGATKGSLDPITGEFAWLTTGSDVGTYIWEFSSSDIFGGIDTETITITVNAAIVTSSGDSSSIGGGVVSSEPLDNIDRSDMNEKYLVLNNPVLFTFKFPELCIYEIAVTGKETENYMALKVEALKGPTKNPGISALSGNVYKNVNVLASSKNIKEGQIRFKVENTWIVNAGNDLMMLKWDGSKWVDLPTIEIKKDDTYTFYEANADSFGSFAIIAMKAEVVPAEIVENSKVNLAPVKASSTPVQTKAPGFEVIIAVFAIAMLAALLKNNKQRR